jgi:hypothetical protein
VQWTPTSRLSGSKDQISVGASTDRRLNGDVASILPAPQKWPSELGRTVFLERLAMLVQTPHNRRPYCLSSSYQPRFSRVEQTGLTATAL